MEHAVHQYEPPSIEVHFTDSPSLITASLDTYDPENLD